MLDRLLRLSFLNWNTRSLEAGSAFVLCFWGAVLLMPYSTFTTNVVFYPMRAIMPHEWVWGCFYLVFGLAQLATVWRGCPRQRGYAAGIASAPYMFLAASHFVGSPNGVVYGVYFIFVLSNWWAAWSARPTGG